MKDMKEFTRGRIPVFVDRSNGQEVIYGKVGMVAVPVLEHYVASYNKEINRMRKRYYSDIRELEKMFLKAVDELTTTYFGEIEDGATP